MTEEMTRAGLEAEARRRYLEAAERGRRNHENWLMAFYTVAILGGIALLFAIGAMMRAHGAAADALEDAEHAHYLRVAMEGGAR